MNFSNPRIPAAAKVLTVGFAIFAALTVYGVWTGGGPLLAEDPEEEVEIEGFQGYPIGGDVYAFEGDVVGINDPSGLTINFGGDLNGESTVTDGAGHFYFSTEIPNPPSHEASATVTYEGESDTDWTAY